MSRADGMQEVELVALDEPASGPADEEAPEHLRRRRRAVLRWWPLAVVAVVALTGSQLVLDARERARVAAAREQPGVVGYDVGPDLVVEPMDPADLPTGDVEAGGLRVGAVDVVPGEPRAVRGVDDASGDEVWRTVLEDAALAAELGSRDYPRCSAGDPPVDEVVCFVQDLPTTETSDGGYEVDAPVRSRLLRIDARTGDVVEERELAPLAGAVAEGADLLRVEVVDDTVRVTKEDTVTGAERWAADLPVDIRVLAGIPGMSPYVWATETHVLVQLSARSWSLARVDGALEVTGSAVWVGRGERLISTALDDGTTRLHGADGSGDVRAVGALLSLAVDDGSVPGLDLLADIGQGDRRILAVDPATGEQVWEHALVGPSEGTALLMDDVLYGADSAAVWAVDARDGREIWRTVRDPEAGDVAGGGSAGDWFNPVTDGRQLLLAEEEAPDGERGPVLRAWSLASGAHRWTAPLPSEVRGWVTVSDGELVGMGPDPVRLVSRS